MESFKCYYPECQKRYNSKYNLIRHLNSYHLDNKSYICPFCGKGFYNKQCLDSHLKDQLCEFCIKPKVSRGVMESLNFLLQENYVRLAEPPPLSLPVLPKIEKSRQVPSDYVKLPISPTILDMGK
jgi:hypothetical protein